MATIQSIQANKDSLLFTTVESHDFEARRTCGQLHIADASSLGQLANVVGSAHKIQKVPSTTQFVVAHPFKHSLEGLEEQLQAANTQLSLGLIQLTFG